MKKSIILSLFVCFVISLSTYAQGAKTVVKEYPFSTNFTTCDGERIVLEGIMVRVNRTNTDSNGGTHHKLKVTIDASGMDSKGNEYTMSGYTINVIRNYIHPDNFVENETASVVIRDNLKGKNRKRIYVGHVAVNKNGYTPYFQHTVTGC